MLRLPFVEIRALITGLTTVPVVMLLTTPHAVKFVLVQPVRLNVYPLLIASRPMTSEVSVGRMYSSPLRMKELLLESVVISNSPFLHRFSLAHSNTKNEKSCGGINLPKASQVDFMRPDTRVKIAAIEVFIQDGAKTPNQGDVSPPEVAPQGSSNDTDEQHGISEDR
jgi:hypothetical protein